MSNILQINISHGHMTKLPVLSQQIFSNLKMTSPTKVLNDNHHQWTLITMKCDNSRVSLRCRQQTQQWFRADVITRHEFNASLTVSAAMSVCSAVQVLTVRSNHVALFQTAEVEDCLLYTSPSPRD